MNWTVTLDLPAETLAAAEKAAVRRQTTLPEVLLSHVKAMAGELASDPVSRITPITDSLRGTISLSPNFNGKAFIAAERVTRSMPEANALVNSIGRFVPLPPDFDARTIIAEERMKKHGGT